MRQLWSFPGTQRSSVRSRLSHHPRVRSRLWMTCAALVLSQPAMANFTCGGSLTYLTVSSAGSVYIRIGSYGTWAVCALGSPMSSGATTATTEACKGWYAGLLAARRTDAPITVYFDSPLGGHNGQGCSDLGSWVVAVPYHMAF